MKTRIFTGALAAALLVTPFAMAQTGSLQGNQSDDRPGLTFTAGEQRELSRALNRLRTPDGRPIPATCVSSDGQMTCVCGDACLAGNTTCGCIKIEPAPEN